MDRFSEHIMTVLLAIVGLAIVAVLVSRNAQTPAVLQSAWSGYNNALAVAEAPVTGAQTPITLAYPSDTFSSGVFA